MTGLKTGGQCICSAFFSSPVDNTSASSIIPLPPNIGPSGVGVVEECRRHCRRHHRQLLPLITDAQRELFDNHKTESKILLVTDAREKVNSFGTSFYSRQSFEPIRPLNVTHRYGGVRRPGDLQMQDRVEEEVHCLSRHFTIMYLHFCSTPKEAFLPSKTAHCFCTLNGKKICFHMLMPCLVQMQE